jgi:nicotinate-nucleotide pyrophosphorylase (carboxylating)
MPAEYQQIAWDANLIDDCRALVQLAIREDLDRTYDWTTVSLVPEDAQGRAAIVARQPGVVAGLPAAQLALAEMDARAIFTSLVEDGAQIAKGQRLAELKGSARTLLTAERLMLNLLGRLSGVATLTRRYVDRVAGASARVFDTRKTTPGWRRLEKYAVRCGGGWNHRLGLFDAILIKDNHLAFGSSAGGKGYTPAEAVRRTRELSAQFEPQTSGQPWIIEVEVDTLEQFDLVLPAGPDVVLLDNMSLPQLREAVARRAARFPAVQLEASGGVNLETVGEIAATGVDRISVGALTHSAVGFDVALDWA